MFRYLAQIVFVATLVIISKGNPITNEISADQEIVFAIATNRHGERAPDADELSLSDQQDLILNLTYLVGSEGLTNGKERGAVPCRPLCLKVLGGTAIAMGWRYAYSQTGKKTGYKLGHFYKLRYGPEGLRLVSNLYNRDEIAIKSTDKERTKMTIQVAMSAMYPPEPEQQWDEGLGKIWQPVPYTAVPLSEDYLRYYSNCDKFMCLMEEAQKASIYQEFQPFMDLMPLLLEKTGKNFTENPLMFQALFDLFRSTVGLGLDIPEWSKPILARLGEAARLAYRLYFRGEEMKKLGGGVTLNKFIEAADDIIAGNPVTQRLRLLSAHDFNLGALMEVSRVKGAQGIPEYGSVFALELYRSRSSGDYSVLPVYLPVAGDSSLKELRITGCENYAYCDYTKFRELVKEYRLPEKEFYRICNIKTEL